MSIDELNDAIGEIPSQLLDLVFGGFVGAGRLMMQFVNVFRDLDERYAEAAQNIAFAQTYIDAFSSALLRVDLPFSSAVVHRFRLADECVSLLIQEEHPTYSTWPALD